MKKLTWITVLLIAISVLFFGYGYNKLQVLEEGVFTAWGNIESTLQRRADIIPNLVEVVKGYAKHERGTLLAVVEARAKATSTNISVEDLSSAEAMANLQKAQAGLSSALSRLLVVVERYPDLKANQNFLDLQHQLEGIENRINVARQRYNQAVGNFNSAIRKFPNNLINNSLLNLERKEYFKADEGSKIAPKVKF